MNKKFSILLMYLLFTLLASFAAFAQVGDDLFYVSGIDMGVDLHSIIRLEKTSKRSAVEKVTAELMYYPADTWRQNSRIVTTLPPAEFTGDSYKFSWDDVEEDSLYYKLSAEVESFNRYRPVTMKTDFPIPEVEPELEEYLQITEKIDIDEDIIELASSLAEGEDDLFSVVFNLAQWTNSEIEYDLNTFTAQASQKASWVLDNRQGVCDEITNLFIAMCRSLGIPAKFVSGISYTNSDLFDEDWGLHGWAEVYFPGTGWVPYDVTYGEFGYIDAGHIKFKDSVDSDKSATKFTWKSYDTDLVAEKLEIDVSVKKVGAHLPENIDAQVSFLNTDVMFGSHNLIEVHIRNLKSQYITTELVLTYPREITILNQDRKQIFLRPKEEKTLYFIVKVADGLNPDYIYTFPTAITTSFNSTFVGSFNAKSTGAGFSYDKIMQLYDQKKDEETKVYSKNIDVVCDFEKKVLVGNSIRFECILKNTGNVNLKDLQACLEEKCTGIDALLISQSSLLEFVYSFDSLGIKPVSLSIRSDDIAHTDIFEIEVIDQPKLVLSEIIHPDAVKYDEPFDISFDLGKESVASPKDITIEFTFNQNLYNWFLDELNSKKTFRLELEGGQIYNIENEFRILITYSDGSGNSFTEEEKFSILMDNPTTIERIKMFLNKLGQRLERFLEKNIV
ncbi:MAG: transglutaminase domain-containing protein [Nanoarchaeota archaeon]|nr:transglutaminase domain-containing protein [Nanoarchaeota archaeon]